jgi:glyoxylase-like metal-dependent hydrolase (beta-lactamase superfamily II)
MFAQPRESEMAGKSLLPPMKTSDDGIYQIYLMRYARGTGRRVHENVMFRDMHDGPMPIDYNLWIIHNDHRTILVDTGFSERAAKERQRQLDFDPIIALGKLGIDPDTLEDVILTHLHYDHAGNLDRFAKARIHVQDAEVSFATGRCMCEPYLRWPFDVEDIVALMRRNYAGRLQFHDGDTAPFPGIRLYHLPGHAKGLQAVHVMTPRGPVLLASDSTHYYANFLRPSPFILTLDLQETLKTYHKLLDLMGGDVQRIIPGHDPKVRRFYPQYEFGGIELTALHEQPKPHTIEDLRRVDDF